MNERPRATARQLALAGLLGTALVLPFLDKGVHQDDWAYLRVSRLMLEHGADVFDQTTLYQGIEISAGQGVLHGPVWLLFLGVAQQVGEHAITVAHLFAAGLLGVLAAACAAIAGRLGAPPVRTALTFVAAPAPWVLATSLMTDLPMLALFATSLALALRAAQDGDGRAGVAAGLFGAAAALTRYHGFAIVPLLGVLPLLLGTRLKRGLVPPLIAVAVFFGFLVTVLSATGRWDMLRATEELSKAVIDREACLMSTVAAFGGVGIGWLAGALAAPRRALAALARHRLVAGCAAVGTLFGVLLAARASDVVPAPLEGPNVVLHWVFFAAGGGLLGALLAPWIALLGALPRASARAAWRERSGLIALIALWSLGFAFAAWFTVPFGSTRYVLPALPGVFLLLGAAFRRELPARSSWVALAVSALVGLGATVADRNAANIFPDLADEVARKVQPDGEWAEGETWIWGELGFRWYLEERAGLRVLPTFSNAPQPGDRILKSMILSTASPNDGSKGRYKLHPDVVRSIDSVSVTEYADPWPIRIHNSYAAAGFYMHEAGFLPWSISTTRHDQLQVWQVREGNPFYEHLSSARVDVTRLPEEGPGQPALEGRVELGRFQVSETVPDRVAIQMLLPARVTWREVPVPADSGFEVWVGEHNRLTYEGIPGPASRMRVLVDGVEVATRRIDTRRGDEKRWYRLVADLSAFGGRPVDLAFELVADPVEGQPKGRPTLLGAFADPRFVSLGD